jgi:cytochrome c biogenesis protein CcdA
MKPDRARRLAEATLEAGLVLGVAALPTAWPVLDAPLALVLAGMLLTLTAATYALHAVTFDCFLLTGHRARRQFSYTQRKE